MVLAIAVHAYYAGKLAGAWRWIYVLTAMIAFYFNVFVLVTQSFLKLPPLKALLPGPEPSGPAFGIAQLAVLVVFAVLTYSAIKAAFSPPAPSRPDSIVTVANLSV